MTFSSFTYSPPIRRRSKVVTLDYEALESAAVMTDEGRAVEAVQKVFQHLFPDVSIPDLSTQPFVFTQGSSQVTARIQNEELEITVPLAQLPTGGTAVAALRYLLTRVSGSGQLQQPRLRGEKVYLEFRDKLTRLHPAKVLEVLQQLPLEADRHDDWLIGQFNAIPLDRAAIEPLSDEEFQRADAWWRAHWNEVDELVKETQRKRSIWFLNESTAFTISRIRLILPMCGMLVGRIAESASTFNNGNEDPSKREAALVRCVKDMKAISSDELRKNLGHAHYAISPQAPGTPAVLKDLFEEGTYIETIDQLRKSGKSLDAALALTTSYTFLLSRYSWSEKLWSEIEAGLVQASGKPFREAATILYTRGQALAASVSEEEPNTSNADPSGG